MTLSARHGAHWGRALTSFSLFSRHAERVDLCLFAKDGTEERQALESRREGHWEARVGGLEPGQLYGYRVDGPWAPRQGHRFNVAKLLMDPAALALTGEPTIDPALCGAGADDDPDPRDSAPFASRSILVDPHFDWAGDRPPDTAWSDSLIYECHVRGLTRLHPDVDPSLRGTYLGLASEPVIEHLQSLGVTAVELLPVQQIASEAHLSAHGLRNYFGYSTLGLFAPHASYATRSGGEQVAEFKTMVKRLHAAGIEVLLDVVFNHTAEGNHLGPTLCLRGIDNRTYYRLDPRDRSRYVDYTGCGNTLDIRQPATLDLVVSCLTYWAEEMHVDGFRFDLAPTLGRDPLFTAEASFFERLEATPALARLKLIAEPWDLGPQGYQLGKFPTAWREWNDRYRDATRSFWRGDPRSAERLRQALAGSPQVFAVPGRGSTHSIDFVTCHDGFTLADLASYETKHNQANGEENRDGSDHNLSRNWGIEGKSDDRAILDLRRRAGRNMLATLALSTGVPMLSHGDEFGRSQSGNNNAYCQDNELTWVDWALEQDQEELVAFVREAFALRRELGPIERVMTLSADARPVKDLSRRSLPLFAQRLVGRSTELLLLLNGTDRARLFRLPEEEAGSSWRPRLATFATTKTTLRKATLRLPAHSLMVVQPSDAGTAVDPDRRRRHGTSTTHS